MYNISFREENGRRRDSDPDLELMVNANVPPLLTGSVYYPISLLRTTYPYLLEWAGFIVRWEIVTCRFLMVHFYQIHDIPNYALKENFKRFYIKFKLKK